MSMQIFKPDAAYCREYNVDAHLVWRSEDACRLEHPGACIDVMDLSHVDDPIVVDDPIPGVAAK